MNPQEVLQLIQQGESETLELKRSLGELREVVETTGAFANAFGGAILVGVSRQKEIIGVTIGTDTLESLANAIKQNTDPAVLPSISTLQVEGKRVIVLRIDESSVKPVLAYGRPFKRVGRSNHRLSSSEVSKLVLESTSASWDAGIVEGIDLSFIDDQAVRTCLTNREYVELNSVSRRTVTNELQDLVKKGIFTQAGKGAGSRYRLAL